MVASQSSWTTGNAAVVAGQVTDVRITPRDAYGNVVVEYGLAFTAISKLSGNSLPEGTFASAYDFDTEDETQLYYIDVIFMVASPHDLSIAQGTEADRGPAVGSNSYAMIIDEVTCSDISSPNADGNACLCDATYARLPDGECGSCLPGFAPIQDRELGCETCKFYPGSASEDGVLCIDCAVGLQPSTDVTSCVPCPAYHFYNMIDSICDTCDAGQELSESPSEPCQMCNDFSFGTTGVCETCSSGQQPNAQRTACFDCPAGFAGMDGECTNCPPGRAPNAVQTSCELCLPVSPAFLSYRHTPPCKTHTVYMCTYLTGGVCVYRKHRSRVPIATPRRSIRVSSARAA
jgi:hypothetical protein